MTRVKICGITTVADALAAVEYGTNALGFVFAKSPRKITTERARQIIENIPPFVAAVGVFVDELAERVMEIALLCRLDTLQFHGRESPEYCHGFDRKVIKTFRVQDGSSVAQMADYDVDAYLLDSPAGGGSGKKFDWNLIKGIKGRIILAGGLTPGNVREAIMKVRPYGVDVSTGVERSPGRKDHRGMQEFIKNVRQCDRKD